ncbi:hypothetical protein ACIBO2_23680 [Nonomuraea sp. NPDC050022]|uniref:hypothetical protein n=1 Tax=Nonomuraea sp. NPDC050022 TaxID=3364358 RepID=UPI00378B87CA
MTLDAETSAKITGYRPQQALPEWEQIAGHVRMLVAASADRSPTECSGCSPRPPIWPCGVTAPACRMTWKCGCGTRRSTRSS